MKKSTFYALGTIGLMTSAPAQAADIFQFNVSGTASGTESYYAFSDTPDYMCWGNYCPAQRGYGQSFSFALSLPFEPDGQYEFYFLDWESRTQFQGSFRSADNGAYLPDYLSFYSTSNTNYVEYSYERFGGTSNFRVLQTSPQPVPEPATWAMMFIGFGAIGGAMRTRKRYQHRVQFSF